MSSERSTKLSSETKTWQAISMPAHGPTAPCCAGADGFPVPGPQLQPPSAGRSDQSQHFQGDEDIWTSTIPHLHSSAVSRAWASLCSSNPKADGDRENKRCLPNPQADGCVVLAGCAAAAATEAKTNPLSSVKSLWDQQWDGAGMEASNSRHCAGAWRAWPSLFCSATFWDVWEMSNNFH